MIYRGFDIHRSANGYYYIPGIGRRFLTLESAKEFVRKFTDKIQTRDRLRAYGARPPKLPKRRKR